eukprot:2288438-Pleurochrysis_carterae.AAC.3
MPRPCPCICRSERAIGSPRFPVAARCRLLPRRRRCCRLSPHRLAEAVCAGVRACAGPVALPAAALGGRRGEPRAPAPFSAPVPDSASMRRVVVSLEPPRCVPAPWATCRAARAFAAPATNASASVVFIAAGYAADAAARAAPRSSRPCATSRCARACHVCTAPSGGVARVPPSTSRTPR